MILALKCSHLISLNSPSFPLLPLHNQTDSTLCMQMFSSAAFLRFLANKICLAQNCIQKFTNCAKKTSFEALRFISLLRIFFVSKDNLINDKLKNLNLIKGKGGMTDVEYQTMFALWCLVKSPLMLGTDMTKITRQV